MRPLKIAFINPIGEIGGAERALLLLLQQLDRTRYAPTLVCLGSGPLTAAVEAIGVPSAVLTLGSAARLSRSGSSAAEMGSAGVKLGGAAVRLLKILKGIGPDLIHTNGIKAHLLGGVTGRVLRCPVLWHMRDLVAEGRLRRLLRAAGAVFPKRIIGVSSLVTDQFETGRARRNARTVHDAVDLSRYRPTVSSHEQRARLGLKQDELVVAMVAHFARWKGHPLFLQALAQLAREGLPVRGLIVGGSIYQNATERAYETELRQQCQDLGLRERVVFTGYQEHVPDFLNAADILVHSPVRPEPFGLAVIEAMALRKPVVAARAGGMLETVEDGVTGILVHPGDPDAIAEAVRGLAGDPQGRITMGEAGHQRVARLFSPDLHFQRIDRIYREMVPVA
jgi:glycosyltransferase involved in cell wall biosynthesis